MREPSRDGRIDKIGRQEGKRDRHVDLADAAPLALGDALGIRVCAGKKFGEPAAARAIDATRSARDSERIGRACCGGIPAGGTVTLIGKFAGQVNPAALRFTLRLSLGAMSA
jgi:hypothetical protein